MTEMGVPLNFTLGVFIRISRLPTLTTALFSMVYTDSDQLQEPRVPSTPRMAGPDCQRGTDPTIDPTPVSVLGPVVDDQTRCIHYASPVDIIAIRFACCGEYYPCYSCHEETASHAVKVWPLDQRDQRAILCGVCRHELTINQYLAVTCCPSCDSKFNPRCHLHLDKYFEVA